MLNTEVIEAYDRMCHSIERVLEVNHIPKASLSRTLGWSRTKLYDKLRSGNFSPEELRLVDQAIKEYRSPKPLNNG